MQEAMELLVRIGGFVGLVIAVCVGIMLLISFVERDRRPNAPPPNERRKE